MSLDALKSSHSIEVEIPSSKVVDQIFDAISYSKGASVIRMLVAYLGLDVFQAGTQKYLKQFAYSNAVTADLWAALGEKAAAIMPKWTSQTGYPVISFNVDDKNVIHASQQRFLSAGADPADETIWPVPIRFVHAAGHTDVLFEAKSGSTGVALDGWIKVNQNQSGFYRVKYDAKLLAGETDAKYLLSGIEF